RLIAIPEAVRVRLPARAGGNRLRQAALWDASDAVVETERVRRRGDRVAEIGDAGGGALLPRPRQAVTGIDAPIVDTQQCPVRACEPAARGGRSPGARAALTAVGPAAWIAVVARRAVRQRGADARAGLTCIGRRAAVRVVAGRAVPGRRADAA